jgi:uncharacterized membrane protein
MKEQRGELMRPLLDFCRRAQYPKLYPWYIIAASMDILTTFIVIEVYSGWEVNKIAAKIFAKFGWMGMIGLKFATVLLVVLICEAVGSRRPVLGKRVAILAIVLGAAPVMLGAVQIWVWFGGDVRHL